MRKVDVCLFEGKCEFKRWIRVSHRGRQSPWMIPLCKWNDRCNQKREVLLSQLNADEAIRKVRVHVKKFYGKAIPIWRKNLKKK